MCINQSYIPNKRIDYKATLHKQYIQVPCGHCVECCAQRQTDVALRAAWEYKRYDDAIGVMLVLTYSDACVPYIHYDGEDVMAVDMRHIKEFINIIRRKYGKEHFSYLIGAEYATDTNRTMRPHYHALFILERSFFANCVYTNYGGHSYNGIRSFVEFCRDIWQGRSYYHDEYQSFKWKYGNLGFLLPFSEECDRADTYGHVRNTKHDYIVHTLGGASNYAAKYAAKQIGFFQKPLIKKIYENGDARKYRDMIPRCVMSRGFGMNMMQDKTFDPVTMQVENPSSHKLVGIPTSVMDMYMYKRIPRGEWKPIFKYSPVFNRYFPVINKNGQPRLRKVTDRVMTTDNILTKMKQLQVRIYDDVLWINSHFPQYMDISDKIAIYLRVYYRMPAGALQWLDGEVDMYKPVTYLKFFRYSTLYHNIKGGITLEQKTSRTLAAVGHVWRMLPYQKEQVISMDILFPQHIVNAAHEVSALMYETKQKNGIEKQKKVKIQQKARETFGISGQNH